MKLISLIKNLDIVETIGDLDIEIEGVSIDSKKVKKSEIFICIFGTNYDSHNLYKEVEKYQAAAIVTEKKLDTKLTQIIVKDSRKALSVVAANFYGNPLKKLKIIGVTGTNGKTTTTHLIKHILSFCGEKVGLIGTNGVYFGSTFYEPTLTTPDPIELHKTLKNMYDYGINYVCMEASAHAIYLNKLYGIDFEAGVFSNCTEDHLDFFKTMENYEKVKTSFFTDYKIKHKIVNADDKTGEKIIKTVKNAISYGIKNPSDIFAINISETEYGVSFVLNIFDNLYDVSLPLIGEFNVYNALSAILCCHELGVKDEKIVEALKNVPIVSGRLEKVAEKNGFKVFVDYAHTPDGLINAIKSLKKLTAKKLILVFGCGGNRESEKREIMGEIAGRYADFTVITSDNPRYEEPMDIIKSIEKGIVKFSDEFVIISSRENAIKYALSSAKKGDTVLIAGKGAEKYQEVLGVKRDFSDKNCVIEILKEM